jgi:hypothetical protein
METPRAAAEVTLDDVAGGGVTVGGGEGVDEGGVTVSEEVRDEVDWPHGG